MDYRDGRPMTRRKVLAALGGVVITGAAAGAAVAASGGHPDASGGPAPGAADTAAGRTAAPRRRPVRTAGLQAHRRRPGARDAKPPTEPVYYIDDGPKTVALTIDDGPSPVYTPQILRVLAKYRVSATFSMVGQNVSYYPQVAREVASAGHLIANHTWSHRDLTTLPPAVMRDEVTRATGEIHAATGRRPAVFRAPYGAWSPALLDYCAAQGLTPLDWSVDPRDWARPGVTAIVANILHTTRSGSIILEHDGGGDRSQTVAALKIVLPSLLDKGYRFRLA
jgi:peptidoglycan/xylan/chitin deacetylase (PgdA/CDA1 family)